ncbi:MAG TPA: hypothetical protein VE868_09395 [Balneolaceae bacterium]|nr:hypothetical protein [Balneolaceae bacterium]
MKGYKPTGQALDSLVAFLNRRLHKNTISRSNIMLTQISDGNQSSYTASDLRNMEAKNRSHFTSGNTLWTYIQVLDGNYSDSSNQNGKVLGLSYYNTSIAIFEKAIRSISGGLGGPPRYKVEGTVIDHEFGHLFGLVNNGTPMVQDHQDTAHGHHCNVKSCLMYYAVETSNTFNNVFNGSIPHIGHYGVADLQANGGK